MLHEPYRSSYDEAYVRDVLVRLTALGPRVAALTGITLHDGRIGVYAYHKDTDEFFFYDNERLPVSYHGTGDVFASATLGGLMRGLSVNDALTLAVDYTLETMRATMADPDRRFYGVNFEEALPMYISRLSKLS
jgi:pyridoxine kinase